MSGEAEDYSSGSFLEDEPVSGSMSKDHESEARKIQVVHAASFEVDEEGNKESFLSALDNFGEVSTSPVSPEDDAVVSQEDAGNDPGGATCMSTIEEESKSCYDSSTVPSASHIYKPVVDSSAVSQEPDLNVSVELKELQDLVDQTKAGLTGDGQYLGPTSPVTLTANVHNPELSQGPSSSAGIDENARVQELLQRLGELQNTQDILERVLDSDAVIDADILTDWISQFPTPIRSSVQNLAEDLSERSISAEIASIQKLVDAGCSLENIDTSNSQNSEVAGGNNLLSDANGVSRTDRPVEDVLREYEELERSYSRASVLDDSFKSDISSVPPVPTYSINPEVIPSSVPAAYVPVIKPPVLKSVVAPSVTSPVTKNPEMGPPHYPPPFSQRTTKEPNSRTRPMPTRVVEKPKSSRMESPYQPHISKSQQQASHSARQSNSGASSSRDNTQDAYKPRNRRMRSPRTIVSPRMPLDSCRSEAQRETSTKFSGAGENVTHHHHHHQQQEKTVNTNTNSAYPEQSRNISERSDYAVAEALKTIQKLSTMVERQETLLEAYSKDNEKLWTQLKDAKTESQEKESNFQEVINSLKTELATLKLNRLVISSKANSSNNAGTQGVLTMSPPVFTNKAELDRLREDAELKTQQLMELRKEVLLLQNKLAAEKSKPAVVKSSTGGGGVSALVFHEKEKEYQKEMNALKKQVRTLQKILYSKDATAPPPSQHQMGTGGNKPTTGNNNKPMVRTKSDVTKPNVNANPHQALIKNIRNTGVDGSTVFSRRSSPMKGVNINTSEIIQASLNCMDQERVEFEKIIEEKNKLIFEKERTILNLKEQVEALKGQLPEGDVVEPGLVEELRSRIINQNKAIQSLKEHLSTFKKLEAENMLLREDKILLEHQVQELRRRLDFAQHLVKPENEVLCLLSEQVEQLNSRYHHREKQLDTLLSKLTLKTTGGGCTTGVVITSSSNSSSGSSNGCVGGPPVTTNLSPRRLPLNQFTNNNDSLGGLHLTMGKDRANNNSTRISAHDILHMADFSPSSSFQLYNDLPEM